MGLRMTLSRRGVLARAIGLTGGLSLSACSRETPAQPGAPTVTRRSLGELVAVQSPLPSGGKVSAVDPENENLWVLVKDQSASQVRLLLLGLPTPTVLGDWTLVDADAQFVYPSILVEEQAIWCSFGTSLYRFDRATERIRVWQVPGSDPVDGRIGQVTGLTRSARGISLGVVGGSVIQTLTDTGQWDTLSVAGTFEEGDTVGVLGDVLVATCASIGVPPARTPDATLLGGEWTLLRGALGPGAGMLAVSPGRVTTDPTQATAVGIELTTPLSTQRAVDTVLCAAVGYLISFEPGLDSLTLACTSLEDASRVTVSFPDQPARGGAQGMKAMVLAESLSFAKGRVWMLTAHGPDQPPYAPLYSASFQP